MAKRLTIILEKCVDCEYVNELDKWVYECGLADKKMVIKIVKNGFPEWCPLPDSD